jgi:hypothetical protein
MWGAWGKGNGDGDRDFLRHDGEMGRLIEAYDWSETRAGGRVTELQGQGNDHGYSAAMTDWITDLVEKMGYAGIVLLMFLANVFPPIP